MPHPYSDTPEAAPTGRTDWFFIISLIVIGFVAGAVVGVSLQPTWVTFA